MNYEKKKEVRKELEQLGAANLAKLHKRLARTTLPDAYWNDHIDQAILRGSESPGGEPARQFTRSYLVAIAAGFLMLLAGTWMFFQSVTTDSGVNLMINELAAISDEEIVKYIDANLDDFDIALLSTYVPETEHDLLFEMDASLDSMEENWPEDAEWLMSVEEGVDLF
jgi:hypothetical protein